MGVVKEGRVYFFACSPTESGGAVNTPHLVTPRNPVHHDIAARARPTIVPDALNILTHVLLAHVPFRLDLLQATAANFGVAGSTDPRVID
jgi:hypothetical protein